MVERLSIGGLASAGDRDSFRSLQLEARKLGEGDGGLGG